MSNSNGERFFNKMLRTWWVLLILATLASTTLRGQDVEPLYDGEPANSWMLLLTNPPSEEMRRAFFGKLRGDATSVLLIFA